MSHNGGWIDAGTDAVDAKRNRKQRLALDEFDRLSGNVSAQSSIALPDGSGKVTLAAAAEKYFASCEARGLDPATMHKYRAAVDPFVGRLSIFRISSDKNRFSNVLQDQGFLSVTPDSRHCLQVSASYALLKLG